MLSDSNELLNPELLFRFSLEKKIKIGEWSLEIAGIMSVSKINSWMLETKKIIGVFERIPTHVFVQKYIALL